MDKSDTEKYLENNSTQHVHCYPTNSLSIHVIVTPHKQRTMDMVATLIVHSREIITTFALVMVASLVVIFLMRWIVTPMLWFFTISLLLLPVIGEFYPFSSGAVQAAFRTNFPTIFTSFHMFEDIAEV